MEADGNQRVHADREPAALAERERDVGGLLDPPVDVIDSLDPHRSVEPRDRTGRRNGPRDRDFLVAERSERGRVPRVEVDRDDPQALREPPEIVRSPFLREPSPHPRLEPLVLENARGQQLAEGLDEVRERRLVTVLVKVPCRVQDRERRLREAGRDLLDVHAEEREVVDVGPGPGRARRVPEEERGRDAVREQRGDVGARRDADEDVEVRERHVLEAVLEGRQGADLVDRSRDAPARADEAELLRARRGEGTESLARSQVGRQPGSFAMNGHSLK